MTVRLSRIVHAGYLVEHAGTTIALDPVFERPFSTNCAPFPDARCELDAVRALRLDAVFLSHHHDDHASLVSLDLLDKRTPIFLYCLGPTLFALIRALGFTDVRALALDVPVRVGAIEVVPRRALDADVDAMFHLRAGGREILDVVDAWIDPDTVEQLARFAPWDVVLWPFQTMRELEVLSPSRAAPASRALPPEWAAQLRALAPRALVPSSCQFVLEPWSWYNRAFFPISYAAFAREAAAIVPDAAIVRLDPGEALEVGDVSARAPPLSWITPVGPRDVDYDYDPTMTAPSTAEVATHFRALDPEEIEIVRAFCARGLIDRHTAADGPYFDAPRRWRLTTYDHTGAATAHDYLVHGDTLARAAPDDDAPLAWSTEIPLAKLHAALTRGEALTSLYVRINDARFTPAIERALARDGDVLEDPLVRALYEGVDAGYQRAQLARLRR